MINVLVIGLTDAMGGIETFVFNNYMLIDREKVHFDFITYWDKCVFEDRLIENGSKVFHFARRGENPYKNFYQQKEFFVENKDTYDYIWANLSSASNINVQLLAQKYTNAKIITHSHATTFDCESVLIKYIHTILHILNKRKLSRISDYRLACSSPAGRWLFGKSEYNLINNGIDLEKFAYSKDTRNNARRELGVDDETLVIGHIGRFTEQKNHLFLVDIFNELHKQNEKSILVLIGEGPLESKVHKRVSDLGLDKAVCFLGKREDAEYLYQAFDVFVLPSLFEGLPVVGIEAQAAELPVVFADTITKEANITGRVNYLSLLDPIEDWCAVIGSMTNSFRDEYIGKQKLEQQGYSIESTAKILEKLFMTGEV